MSSDDPPSSSKDIDLTSQPAVVSWQDSDEQQSILHNLHFDLHYNVASDKAFFKIWTKVALKASRNQLKRIFFLIRPELVHSLTFEETPDFKHDLGSTTVCFRFVLTSAAILVGPKVDLTPRNKSSGDKLDALRLLSGQLSFCIYTNPTTRLLPRAQISSLCTLISQHRLRSILDHANVNRLYAGQGSQVIEVSSETKESAQQGSPSSVDGDATTASMPSSPPSYDELPSPPPGVEPQAGPSKKRRRAESCEEQITPREDMPVSRKLIEEICTQIIDSRLASLKCDMSRQLEDLEGRLMDHIHEQIDEVREEARQETGAMIDDEFYGVKAELQDYVEEEFKQVEERFVERINSAKVSLEIEL